jgi:hypothetical protein
MRVLLELDLACRQRFPVCLAEYREQDLCAQSRVVRLPIDIEKMRVAAWPSAGQHVCPPGVVGDRGHVVRHDIDNEAHAACSQRCDQPLQRLFAAELRIDAGRINHVVSVERAFSCRHDRGRIEMADPERGKIRNATCRVVEREILMELEAHGGARRIHARRLRASASSRLRTSASLSISPAFVA